MIQQLQVDDDVTCDNCGETFQAAVTSEEAMVEFNLLFQGKEQPAGIVCDDCFNTIMAQMHPKQ